jgi:hypothetical protein
MCITTQIDSSLPDLFTTSQSSSHGDFCHFKVRACPDKSPQLWGLSMGIKGLLPEMSFSDSSDLEDFGLLKIRWGYL